MPSVNAQCTRGSVKDLKGPLNSSSYCPYCESCRPVWVQLAHIQITQGKLFIWHMAFFQTMWCLTVGLPGPQLMLLRPKDINNTLWLFYFELELSEIACIAALCSLTCTVWNKVCSVPRDAAGGYMEAFEGLKLGLLWGTSGAVTHLLPVADSPWADSPWSELSLKLSLGVLKRPRVVQNVL